MIIINKGILIKLFAIVLIVTCNYVTNIQFNHNK